MKQHYLELLEYDIWANERVYDSIINTKNINEKAIALLSHIAASQKIWLSRVSNKGDNPMHPWDPFIFEELLPFIKQVAADWSLCVSETSDEKLLTPIKYKNSQGIVFENTIKDILSHMINHSTYHRGQIAAIVKLSGGIPAVTDYIVFKRDSAGAS